MLSPFTQATGQRPIDSRSVQQPACSCSYTIQPSRDFKRGRKLGHVAGGELISGRRPSSACAARTLAAGIAVRKFSSGHPLNQRGRSWCLAASSEPPPSEISGYTPANYISYSDDPDRVATHSNSVTVNAPASVCFSIWNDWNRLVEYLDLVAQIGLDPNNMDLALFQCFYRHGVLPVMEIVFVLQKTEVVQDKRIAFDSVWGMPLAGYVEFTEQPDGQTLVHLHFSHALPDLLVDLKVGVFGVQTQMINILSENLDAFKQLAEEVATDPANAPPRPEGGERMYPVFDEAQDMQDFINIMDNLEFSDDEEEEDGQEGAAQQSQQQAQQPLDTPPTAADSSGSSSSSRAAGAAMGSAAAGARATAAAGGAAAGGAAAAAAAAGSSGQADSSARKSETARKPAGRATAGARTGTGSAGRGGVRAAAPAGAGTRGGWDGGVSSDGGGRRRPAARS